MASVLVACAHPDDDLLGVGGTIRRHVEAGDDVTVAIVHAFVRNGEERREDAMRVATLVGHHLDFYYNEQQGDCPASLFDGQSYDVVYTHHPFDLNRDHRRVAQAALIAGRSARTVRTFETLSSTEWGTAPFVPDYYVAIDIHAKLDALHEYDTEMREPPHPRSYEAVEALARLRGSTAGLHHAEAFHTVRDTWR